MPSYTWAHYEGSHLQYIHIERFYNIDAGFSVEYTGSDITFIFHRKQWDWDRDLASPKSHMGNSLKVPRSWFLSIIQYFVECQCQSVSIHLELRPLSAHLQSSFSSQKKPIRLRYFTWNKTGGQFFLVMGRANQ